MNTFDMPVTKCTDCGYEMDALSDIVNHQSKPKEGDIQYA